MSVKFKRGETEAQWRRRTQAEWNARRLAHSGSDIDWAGIERREAGIWEGLRLEKMAPGTSGKRLGMVVPQSARCRGCGISGRELPDPDKWACWENWCGDIWRGYKGCCITCAKKEDIEQNKKDLTPDPVRVMARKAGAFLMPDEKRAVARRHKSTPRVRVCRDLKKKTGLKRKSGPKPKPGGGSPYGRDRPSWAKQITLWEAGLREPKQVAGTRAIAKAPPVEPVDDGLKDTF